MSVDVTALFRTLTYGVYVIGVAHQDERNAFTAAWVVQASFDPLILALSIHPEHASFSLLREGRAFSVNVLGRGQLELARRFGTSSGRDHDKFGGVRWRTAVTGAPILEDAVAFFDCRLSGSCRAGDHEIVIGRVVDGDILAGDAAPMTYAETGDLDGSSALYPRALPSTETQLP